MSIFFLQILALLIIPFYETFSVTTNDSSNIEYTNSYSFTEKTNFIDNRDLTCKRNKLYSIEAFKRAVLFPPYGLVYIGDYKKLLGYVISFSTLAGLLLYSQIMYLKSKNNVSHYAKMKGYILSFLFINYLICISDVFVSTYMHKADFSNDLSPVKNIHKVEE